MSDYSINVITQNPNKNISYDILTNATNYIKGVLQADAFYIKTFEYLIFVDSGTHLESIKCPYCHDEINFEWWNIAMEKAYKTHFVDLEIDLPCCHNKTSLNDLNYDFPCGFSKIKIEIINPVQELSKENIYQIELLLDCPIRIINTHI
ncbi:MAG: hypothetical protein RR630_08615 [Coprobacillus sp.]